MIRSYPTLASLGWGHSLELIFDGHCLGIDGFLAGDSFEAGEDATIVVLIALHGEAAFLVAVLPGEADEMFLRLGESHERSHAEADNGEADGGADTTMDILSVTDFGDGRGRNVDGLFTATRL
jgi:hypothetical protein